MRKIMGVLTAAAILTGGVGNASAAAIKFVFRYNGKIPVTLTAAPGPEEPPLVFDPTQLEFGPHTPEFEFRDNDRDGKVSIGDVFRGGFVYINKQPLQGEIEVRAAGLPPGYEVPWARETAKCTVVSSTSGRGGSVARWCRHAITIAQKHIDQFCSDPLYRSYAGRRSYYTPWAVTPFGQKPLVENTSVVATTCG